MDEKLIKKAIKGNFKAYSLLVHSLKNEGYKLAYTILKNEQDSIDAYLQAVEKGLKSIQNLKEPQYFKTWFLRIVINEAKNILISTEYSLKEIAFQCAFNDEKYFLKVFKKIEGVSPTEYKKAFFKKKNV